VGRKGAPNHHGGGRRKYLQGGEAASRSRPHEAGKIERADSANAPGSSINVDRKTRGTILHELQKKCAPGRSSEAMKV